MPVTVYPLYGVKVSHSSIVRQASAINVEHDPRECSQAMVRMSVGERDLEAAR